MLLEVLVEVLDDDGEVLGTLGAVGVVGLVLVAAGAAFDLRAGLAVAVCVFPVTIKTCCARAIC